MTIPYNLEEARRVAQPADLETSPADSPYRAVSIFVSYWLARAKMSANQVTLLWILVGVAAVVALGSARFELELTGAVLLQISYLLDFVDGEVARLQNRFSKQGLFLDFWGHGLIKTGLFLSLGYGQFLRTQVAEIFFWAIVAAIAISSLSALPHLETSASLQDRPSPVNRSALNAPSGLVRALIGYIGLIFESPGLYAAILIGVALQVTRSVLVFYGVAAPLWLAMCLAKHLRRLGGER